MMQLTADVVQSLFVPALHGIASSADVALLLILADSLLRSVAGRAVHIVYVGSIAAQCQGVFGF